MANIVVEVPWQILTAIVTFACYYYAIVGVQSSDRQVLVLLFTIQLFLFASTFAHMCIAALPDAQTASAVVTLLVLLSILFNGVLQAPSSLPRFWIFMYRVSPFTYWVGGIVATVLHDRSIVCSPNEFSTFDPADGQTCGQYLSTYLQNATGYLSNPETTQACRYCAYKVADQYLAGSSIFWSERWRNFGIMFAFIGFNVLVAVVTYYLFRIQKPSFAFLDRKKRAA
jgi:ATP-binding cassette subfamily G (WHITE) protein 2 (PDR)